MKKYTASLVTLACFAAVQAASAQSVPTPAYVSISGGVSHINADCSGTTSCDNDDKSGKLLVGYQFVPGLAAEASIGYLGKSTATVPDGGTSISASMKGRSVGLGLAVLAPFGASRQWTGIARLGVASVRTTVDASAGGSSGSDAETKAQAYGGLGLNYALTPQVEVGVAYDVSRLEYSGQKGTVSSFNVVGTFKF